MRWQIYYGDDSTYSDRDGSPFDAPSRDVQVIACEANNDQGFELARGKDFYWWRENEGGWFNGDIYGLFDYLQMPGPRKVIFGRSMGWTKDYNTIVARAGREGLG